MIHSSAFWDLSYIGVYHLIAGGIAQAVLLKIWLEQRGANALIVKGTLLLSFFLVVLGIAQIVSLVAKTKEYQEGELFNDISIIIIVIVNIAVVATVKIDKKD